MTLHKPTQEQLDRVAQITREVLAEGPISFIRLRLEVIGRMGKEEKDQGVSFDDKLNSDQVTTVIEKMRGRDEIALNSEFRLMLPGDQEMQMAS